MDNIFKDKLKYTDDFLITFELVPGRSATGKSVNKVLSFAMKAKDEHLLDALSITDNPGGNPSLSPDALGREIKEMGVEPIVHFACRDNNRYGAFSRALQLNRLAIENLLVVTGDYPNKGPAGIAKPCFDLDSVTLLCILGEMNRGYQAFCKQDNHEIKMSKTGFFFGAAVSCFKLSEAEVINQYYKLLKKIRNGAQFIITQICYDARKFDELLRFLRAQDIDIPVFGSVYILNKTVARIMNEGKVPGAFVTDKLLREIQSESKAQDKGKSASLQRAAKLMAILKGLGYRGAHIGGELDYEDVRTIILHFREIQKQWRDFLAEFDLPYPSGFYLYEKDNQTGLNTTNLSGESRTPLGARINYSLMKVFHHLFFNQNAIHFPLLKGIGKIIDKSAILKTPFFWLEDVSKSLLFECKRCGDCALPDMAYLCPESQCPKFLRNGPCGGSEQQRCEVRKERLCVWVKIYHRLKSHQEQYQLKESCVPPRDWSLNGTSSWLNFYLERDYSASIPCHRCQGKNSTMRAL
ncbi:methylenetetrahydrofolate reductase C-terminal domain-containing protein [bacterium]|nr:methylenetetrahydrofolate reductase C-terminal domain-containing protein [bacterium]